MLSLQLKTGLVVGASALGLKHALLPKVRADDNCEPCDTKSEPEPCTTKKKIKITELPIYVEAEPLDVVCQPENISSYREKVSVCRQYVEGCICKIPTGFTDNVQQKWEVSKTHTNDMVQTFQKDETSLHKAAFITVAGLGGVVLAYKGGKLKKVFYGSVGALTAASLCFPKETVRLAERGYNKAYDSITGGNNND